MKSYFQWQSCIGRCIYTIYAMTTVQGHIENRNRMANPLDVRYLPVRPSSSLHRTQSSVLFCSISFDGLYTVGKCLLTYFIHAMFESCVCVCRCIPWAPEKVFQLAHLREYSIFLPALLRFASNFVAHRQKKMGFLFSPCFVRVIIPFLKAVHLCAINAFCVSQSNDFIAPYIRFLATFFSRMYFLTLEVFFSFSNQCEKLQTSTEITYMAEIEKEREKERESESGKN